MTKKKKATPEFPYLTVRNWDKYQSKTKSDKSLPWVRDYTDQTVDDAYSRLTLFQRAVLQECRRLRGRLGKNIPNDAAYIGRAACVLPEERRLLPRALSVLVLRGLLEPSVNPLCTLCATGVNVPNTQSAQQPSSPEESRGEDRKSRVEESRAPLTKVPEGFVLENGKLVKKGGKR